MDQKVRDGAWATYHDDDTPQLEASYAAGELQSLTWSNEAGEIKYERTYGDTEVVRLFGEEGVQFGVADNLTDLFALIDLVPHEEPDFDSMEPARHL